MVVRINYYKGVFFLSLSLSLSHSFFFYITGIPLGLSYIHLCFFYLSLSFFLYKRQRARVYRRKGHTLSPLPFHFSPFFSSFALPLSYFFSSLIFLSYLTNSLVGTLRKRGRRGEVEGKVPSLVLHFCVVGNQEQRGMRGERGV